MKGRPEQQEIHEVRRSTSPPSLPNRSHPFNSLCGQHSALSAMKRTMIPARAQRWRARAGEVHPPVHHFPLTPLPPNVSSPLTAAEPRRVTVKSRRQTWPKTMVHGHLAAHHDRPAHRTHPRLLPRQQVADWSCRSTPRSDPRQMTLRALTWTYMQRVRRRHGQRRRRASRGWTTRADDGNAEDTLLHPSVIHSQQPPSGLSRPPRASAMSASSRSNRTAMRP
jgi:hypothetical protein